MPTENFESCKLCGQKSNFLTHTAREMMFGTKEEFKYKSCPSCKSVFIAEVPTNLLDYYPDNYYSFVPLVISSKSRNRLKALRYAIYRITGIKKFQPFFSEWFDVIEPPLNATIADVGCGNGQLLYELYAAGYKYLSGYDPYVEQTKEIAKGVKVYKKELSEASAKFDLIMMHHALEHLADPAEAFKDAFEHLNTGGCFLVRVPVTDSKVWEESGVDWVQLDAPRHLFVPSVQGLTTLAAKFGFETKKVIFDSKGFQFWGTELYKKDIPLRYAEPEKIFPSDVLEEYEKKALLYNEKGLGDQACFYFFKP